MPTFLRFLFMPRGIAGDVGSVPLFVLEAPEASRFAGPARRCRRQQFFTTPPHGEEGLKMRRLDDWYNTLKEPWRFLFTMTLVAFLPGLCGVVFGIEAYPIAMIPSLVWAFYRLRREGTST